MILSINMQNLENYFPKFENSLFKYTKQNFIKNLMESIGNINFHKFKTLRKTLNKKNFKNLTKNKEAISDLKFYKKNLKRINETIKKLEKFPCKRKLKIPILTEFLIERIFYLHNIRIAYYKLRNPQKTSKYFEKTFRKASQILDYCLLDTEKQIEPYKIVLGLNNIIDNSKTNFIYRDSSHLDSTKTLLDIIEIIYFSIIGKNTNNPLKAFESFEMVSYLAKKVFKDFPNHPNMSIYLENLRIAKNNFDEYQKTAKNLFNALKNTDSSYLL